MYTTRRGLGCTSCQRSRGLGIAPVIVAAAIPAVENLFSSLFGSSQTIESGVTQEVQSDVQTIANDLGNIATPGTTAYNTFLKLRCLAGDQSIESLFYQAYGETPPSADPGCGYAHQDSRNYARSGVLSIAGMALAQGLAVPRTYVFKNDSPAGTSATMTATPSSTGTALTTSPGGASPTSYYGTPAPVYNAAGALGFSLTPTTLLLGAAGLAAIVLLGEHR